MYSLGPNNLLNNKMVYLGPCFYWTRSKHTFHTYLKWSLLSADLASLQTGFPDWELQIAILHGKYVKVQGPHVPCVTPFARLSLGFACRRPILFGAGGQRLTKEVLTEQVN